MLNLGRVSLTAPLGVKFVKRRTVTTVAFANGTETPFTESRSPTTLQVRGREILNAQATLDLLEREGDRVGAMYVSDGGVAITTGYYELGDIDAEKPGGAPGKRPWTVSLTRQLNPFVCRQAEDDNITGADTADANAEEGSKVVYTPTTSEVVVLQPRTVTGAEAVNLPAGTYRVIARAYQITNSSAKLRLETTDLAGSVLVSGAQVVIGAADTWTELDLGSFTVASANAGANWYRLSVQGVAAQLGDVWIDRVFLVSQ